MLEVRKLPPLSLKRDGLNFGLEFQPEQRDTHLRPASLISRRFALPVMLILLHVTGMERLLCAKEKNGKLSLYG